MIYGLASVIAIISCLLESFAYLSSIAAETSGNIQILIPLNGLIVFNSLKV